MAEFKVERYSGLGPELFKVKYQGVDEVKAFKIFEKISKELRQGTVNLSKDNVLIKKVSFPRLRTRW